MKKLDAKTFYKIIGEIESSDSGLKIIKEARDSLKVRTKVTRLKSFRIAILALDKIDFRINGIASRCLEVVDKHIFSEASLKKYDSYCLPPVVSRLMYLF